MALIDPLPSPQSDRAYFSERAREERAAAEATNSDDVRKAHLELAFRYEDLAAALYRAEWLDEKVWR